MTGISERQRAEELSIEVYAKLAGHIGLLLSKEGKT